MLRWELLAVVCLTQNALAQRVGSPLPEVAPQSVSFQRDVLPILATRCFSCHADDNTEGELRLNSRDRLLAGGASGPAIIPGNSAESLLIQLTTGSDPDRVMPAEGEPLSPAQIGLLRAWVDQGALWEDVRPYDLNLRTVTLPPGKDHPIDRLLAPYFASHGVSPGKSIGDASFARRSSLDLLGIPPSPTQLAAFLSDRAPDKRQRWIAQLLGDQQNFAGHWMTFWSDHLRIGSEVNSGTFDNDNTDKPKEWLKDQLDRNAPLDEFARQMVAGEFYDQFAVSVAPEGDFNSVVDRAEMQMAALISQVFLGVQMKCASCHDSFVDRWKLQDAWGLAVALGEDPIEIQRCQAPTGEMAQPHFPLRELGTIDGNADVAARRKRVADLLTSADNGLFSRTLVNRLWARLFGRGIVTPLDEMMENEPWNPDLLDWLAAELIRLDYDVKGLLKLIMTSEAYQLPAAIRKEPVDEEYVFHGPEMRRLTAEQFIDSLRLLAQQPAADDASAGVLERSWQLRGSRLMTMLGRPTRDVVVSARSEEPSPLLALELINGGELDDLTTAAARVLLDSQEDVDAIVARVYGILLTRAPTSAEGEIAAGVIGTPASVDSVSDLIWSIVMLPEFQLVP